MRSMGEQTRTLFFARTGGVLTLRLVKQVLIELSAVLESAAMVIAVHATENECMCDDYVLYPSRLTNRHPSWLGLRSTASLY